MSLILRAFSSKQQSLFSVTLLLLEFIIFPNDILDFTLMPLSLTTFFAAQREYFFDHPLSP